MSRKDPHAIIIIESALIFSTKYAPGRGWRDRFDCIILVTAPDDIKIDRFIQRTAAISANDYQIREDARRRLQAQRAAIPADIPTYTIENDRSLADLQREVDDVWRKLAALENSH